MDDVLEEMTQIFFKLHRCYTCRRFFTEKDNICAHKCWYHPGEYDSSKDMYTCCGEKRRYCSTDYHRYMNYTSDYSQNYRDFSSGCTPCDCRSIYTNKLPYKDVSVIDFAPMLIYIKNIDKRPGYDAEKLALLRRGAEIKRATNAQTTSS